MSRFPPRATFSRSERVGGIALAPLAEFLSHLHDAPHLIKLADILERYRTPKSYHRFDFRIADSSELPPSPGVVDDEEVRKLWERARGSPIIVDDATPGDGVLASAAEEKAEGDEAWTAPMASSQRQRAQTTVSRNMISQARRMPPGKTLSQLHLGLVTPQWHRRLRVMVPRRLVARQIRARNWWRQVSTFPQRPIHPVASLFPPHLIL
ncbi:hypothetical protein CC85DRAFT_291017 [Cutaneotrichosporon oleaginosum]|uniref:Uncharacterized protein n=1 Tax=Cutaneotrichosporon oleaginosum TaxID=879819 RepID=A0A0J0XSZ7_9TREE|nr:uncharacterized protein CC85DRAFT_291017 [Cutaneotrichosporon oleaginosum]KLT44201.1 hypothetical protein CC85DRAFT_291017 [Cutaneotrichosporon oleaginosum]TXT11630.1 hypothetical protein COLE_02040 [Cutaneotrichosporon oleaginosum]